MASQHAFDQVKMRIMAVAQNTPQFVDDPTAMINLMHANYDIAEKMYKVPASLAVQFHPTLPYLLGQERAYNFNEDFRKEPSNGNMLIGIVRGGNTVTFMFRRSPNLGRISQPFTPDALQVDEVVPYELFQSDKKTFIAKDSKILPRWLRKKYAVARHSGVKQMKVKNIIEQLSKLNPELDGMFQDPNHGGPFSVESIQTCVSEGEFPNNWNMPEGFEYVLLRN
jgi:hypothetical protein